jgi:5-formyltetrahydrofolate cyclo-ligase
MTKQELRKIYLEKRQSLSGAEYGQLSFQLYQNFFSSIDLSFVRVMHVFLAIPSKKEVDTWLLIDRIRREFPHIRISVPRVNNLKGELENFYFEGLHQLTTNNWGIQEPKQGIPTETEKIDFVVVPLLAFDKRGYRIGYGKGYYDEFLARCNPATKKIGLSFFPPLERVPNEAHDVPLTGCVTPNGIIEF